LQDYYHTDIIYLVPHTRGLSSAGRALAWHARGRRFDPDSLHIKNLCKCKGFFVYLISWVLVIAY
jgi:hypothetical protein